MRLYKFDKDTLEYKRVDVKIKLKFIGVVLSIAFFVIFCFGVYYKFSADGMIADSRFLNYESLEDDEKIIVINEGDEFTEQKLVDYILELNIKFPDIAFAQARYESGNFGTNPNADLFETNHNLFGMKVATARPTTNIGEQYGHALYNNWRMSVMDYALWQANMTKGLNTREEYVAFLRVRYCEGTYVSIEQITKEARNKYPELCVKKHPILERTIIK